jgi:thioredoxin 1
MKIDVKSACLLLLFAAVARPQTSDTFKPFAAWKAAVAAGDKAALAQLYSTAPPAMALIGKTRLDKLEDEWTFWASLKTAAVTEFNPKILEIESNQKETRLVLRLNAVKAGQNFIASMQQVWVPQAGSWRLAASQRSEFHPDAGRRLPEPVKPNSSLYPEPSAAPAELRTASALAAKENKRVLVVFGANWCYDCHVLDTTFHSSDFAPLLKANYVILHVSIGDDGKDNNDLAAHMGVALDKGVPSLAVLEPDGKVVVAQHGEFESTVKIGPQDVHDFLEKWKPAKRKS